MRRIVSVIGFGLALALAAPAAAQQNDPVLGIWATQEQAEVTVAHCPAGLCGYLSRIVIPEEHAGSSDKIAEIGIENLKDMNNKDPALRGRPLLGMELLILGKQLSPVAYEGEIYNPEDGNLYYGKLELMDANRIKLTGCALVILCQAQEWYRVPDPPPVPTPVAQRPN